jgi:hypothetical protein
MIWFLNFHFHCRVTSQPQAKINKQNVQSQYGDEIGACSLPPPSQPAVSSVLGERDELGRLHGEVEIFYQNGDYFWGDLQHGLRSASRF